MPVRYMAGSERSYFVLVLIPPSSRMILEYCRSAIPFTFRDDFFLKSGHYDKTDLSQHSKER
jgi:hypothetical protein